MNRKTSLSCSSLLIAAGLSVVGLSAVTMAEAPRQNYPAVDLNRAALLQRISQMPDIGDVPEEAQSDRVVTCQPTFGTAVPVSPPANCIGLYGTQGTSIVNFVPSDTSALVDVTGAGDFELLPIFTAENFVPATSGNLDGVCFYGRYLNEVTGFFVSPPATTIQTFRVRYFSDGGGFPCGTPIAEFRIGALTPTAGTSVTRVSGAGTVGPTGTYFRYTLNHPAVPVTAGTCLWVEIVDDTPGTEFLNWVGEGLDNGQGDNLSALHFENRDQYSATDIGAPDMTLCITQNMAPITCAVAGGAPANDAITSPTALTIPTAATPANNIGATADLGPACGGRAVDADGVWYSVVGNGTTLTFSTDGSQCHDTQVIVYDATAFDVSGQVADLICVGANDDRAADDLDSEIAWCSGTGTRYLIYVAGLNSQFVGTNFLFDGGSHEANFSFALSAGAACSPADSNPCSVVAAITDVLELETCGGDSNTGCGLAEPINVGDTVFGTFFAGSPGFFDQDIDDYGLTLVAPTELDFTIEAESAATIVVVDCSGPAAVDQVSVAECVPGPHLRLTLPAGSFSVQVTTFSAGGTQCSSGWENYRLTVAPSPAGACCVGTICSTLTPAACNDMNGTWLGDTIACTSTPCDAPCVTTLGTPAEAEACLTDPSTSANNTCATANSLTLGTASFGTLSTGDGMPAPGTRDIDLWAFTLAAASDVEITVEAQSNTTFQLLNCPAQTVVAGSTFDSPNCLTAPVTIPALPAGDYALVVTTFDFFGSPCGGGTNNYSVKVALPGPACPPQFVLANFNDAGASTGLIDVVDLFDFLDAWFAQTGGVCTTGCSADVVAPSGSPDVTDLFDFLDAWFATNGQVCP